MSTTSVPKAVRVFVHRCYAMHLACRGAPLERTGGGRGSRRGSTMRTAFNLRRRSHGAQGKAVLVPELRHELFNWFLMIRKIVKGRLWPRHALSAAKAIKKKIIAFHVTNKLNVPRFPKLNGLWLWRWMRSYGISLRKPNRRYKVSRSKMARGLTVTWKNIFRARLAFRLLYGEQRRLKKLPEEPSTAHVDQKPLHFNEGESKDISTIDLVGEEDIPLKTNTSASRSRLTANTMVVYPAPPSDVPGESWAPPVEILFKLKTDRRVKVLRLPPGVSMSLTHSASGSYNEEAFLNYLRRHLPELTPQRISDCDFRILALDAFEVHKMDSVRQLCHSRGYIVLFHRGGTTSVGQWNDTDLHFVFERHYLDLEERDFSSQRLARPWACPTRTRQAIVDDIACVFAGLPHKRIGENAAKRTGWMIALPDQKEGGTFSIAAREDDLVSRESRVFFDEVDMPSQRAADLPTIVAAVAEGRIRTWVDVQEFMLAFEDDEIEAIGQELLDDVPSDDEMEAAHVGGVDDMDGVIESLADVAKDLAGGNMHVPHSTQAAVAAGSSLAEAFLI